MPADYTDIFAAKERITRILRESGSQPYSRLLMNSQLPEEVLRKVIELLQKEKKVKVVAADQAPTTKASGETVYQPVSGAWALSGLGV